MLNRVFILLTIVAMSQCQSPHTGISHKKKHCDDPYYHHHMLFGGLLYYLVFILVKIKVAFVIGAILTVFIVAGKFFTLIKYAEYMKEKPSHHEREKIYVPEMNNFHDHGHLSHSPPVQSYPTSYSSPYYPGLTVDKLPPNAEIAGNQYYDSPPPYSHGRSNDDKKNNSELYGYYQLFTKMLQKLNVTEIAFNTMKINSSECRKKLICKINYNAKYSTILRKSLYYIRDDSYGKYTTKIDVQSLEDCDKLYQSCQLKI